MSLLVAFSICILLIYALLLLMYLTGWNHIKDYSPGNSDSSHFISVVIAYRNEEERISFLLNDLAGQNYPVHQFEIIAVDDHSEDNSFDIVEKQRLNSKVRIISLHLPDGLCGKKNAISYGIESSKGKLILITDADCRISRNWITSFASFYHCRGNPKLIIGLVDLRKASGVLARLQNLEFLSLMASGAGAAGIRKPIYCSSANLMFEKGTYTSMKDPLKMSVVSGDDTFLLHQIKRMHPGKILVLKCQDAIVETEPATKLKEFVNQRIRWISKGKYYKDFQIIASASIVMASNLTILGWMVAGLVSANVFFLLPLIFKMIIDWLLMIPVLSYFHKEKLHFLIPVLTVLYPFYVTIFALAGLSGSFTWKGRKYIT